MLKGGERAAESAAASRARARDAARTVLLEMSGPIVLPHGQSFLTMNSCTSTPAMRASSRTTKPVSPFVA